MLDGDDGLGRRKLVQRTIAERAAIVVSVVRVFGTKSSLN